MKTPLGYMGAVAVLVGVAACTSPPRKAPVIDRTRAIEHARPTQQSTQQYKVVARGDTLYAIAFATGHNYRDLAVWNGIAPPYLIYPGQKIGLNPPSRGAPATTNAKPGPLASAKKKTPASRVQPAAAKSKPGRASGKTLSKRTTNRNKFENIEDVGRWRWPVKGALLAGFNSTGRTGINIGGGLGKPIAAAADGQVVYSGGGLRGYGKLIIIKHSRRYLSAYAHNDKILVREGQTVKRGSIIAKMGRSGTDSVMLHFEIRRDGKPVNPTKYLPK